MNTYKSASLTPEEIAIIDDRGTERPFTGKYNEYSQNGTYLCRRCGLGLFRGHDKFTSGCGWPSYDDQIADNVRSQGDPDGVRDEIVCARCDAHLGHVFIGEGLTDKNTRYCVNSLSVDFVPFEDVVDSQEVILAAGCFWGVEYLFKQREGVLKTESGYCGGDKDNPSYQEVCHGNTGHVEAVRVIFDPKVITYQEVIQFFFEIHNFEQDNGQGPDIGSQYLSRIFYYDDEEKIVADKLLAYLKEKGYQPSTELLPAKPFWPAEDYHQDYYIKNQKQPYCHRHQSIF